MNHDNRIAQLESLLSEPDERVGTILSEIDGPLVILGADGKMGPTLAWLARRSVDAAGKGLEIIAISRFGNPERREWFEEKGIRTIPCDLLDRQQVASLPESSNIIYLAGKKFGTSDNPSLTWSMNTLAPAHISERYSRARIVALSSGAVYPMVPVSGGGSVESDPLTPPGEYANACVARERIFEYYSRLNSTPMTLVRLNYAVEPRYGVLVDVGLKVWRREEIDLTMGDLNCIWGRDANRMIIAMLPHAATPPTVMNLTGRDILKVKEIALAFGERFGIEPRFSGEASDRALLNNASRTLDLLGEPEMEPDQIIDLTAEWIASDAPLLGKPTHYEIRDGGY